MVDLKQIEISKQSSCGIQGPLQNRSGLPRGAEHKIDSTQNRVGGPSSLLDSQESGDGSACVFDKLLFWNEKASD